MKLTHWYGMRLECGAELPALPTVAEAIVTEGAVGAPPESFGKVDCPFSSWVSNKIIGSSSGIQYAFVLFQTVMQVDGAAAKA